MRSISHLFVLICCCIIVPQATAGAFCLCSNDNTRGARQPLSCTGKCPPQCTKEYDVNEDDYIVKGCNSNTRITLCHHDRCVEKIYITSTGYSDGHKGWWCKSVGFDDAQQDSHGNHYCVRSCSDKDPHLDTKGCLKRAMGCMGYTDGNKQDFCKARGYSGGFNHRASIDWNDKLIHGSSNVLEPGYCYVGKASACTWATPSVQSEGKGKGEMDLDPCRKFPNHCVY